MPTSDEDIITCYACDAPMNVAAVAPYSRVICPGCNTENRVKKQFGPYTLTRRHAIGGMSSVFIAKDEALDREVALKILSEEYSNDETRITAFEEEARLTASFSHPNVVRVLTTGKAFDRFYIAMEFVPGGHFEHQIREKGQVSETEILPLAIQVAEGLKGAQAAGLIHRDVKPGNILLDSEGNAKIVDFGLALVTKGGTAKATEIWATPYYVPPEAIEGESEDFRADIYAFGATLYHALAGKPPCDEESMSTDLLREAKKKILPLKKVAPHLLEETCSVIDRAMAYEPSKRFSSYDEMIADLQTAFKIARGEAMVDSEGITKAERRAELRARKLRNKILMVSAGVIGTAGVAALVLLNRPDPEPTKQEPKALTVDAAIEGDTESPREIATRYNSALKLMETGEFEKAVGVFSSLLQDDNVQEPTRTWSGIQSVAAALMDGRMNMARDCATAAEAHVFSEPTGLDPGFLVGVQPVIREMSGYAFFDVRTLDLGESGNIQFMGYFLAALKNWECGGLVQAVPFFEILANEQSLSGDSVLGRYQEMARKYLHDYEYLTSDAMDANPQTVDECREVIEELNRQLTLLKTKGRARFNIRARQLDFAKLEKILREKPRPSAPLQPDRMKEIESLARNYMFVDVVDRVSKLESNPPGYKRKSLLEIAQAALVFLSEIESDIETTPATIELTMKDGTIVTSIMIASGEELLGKLANGEILDIEWTNFDANQIIALHRELVKSPASELERLRRHESAIAFDWLCGDRDRALAAAGRLSEESESFKSRWNSLASGLPK